MRKNDLDQMKNGLAKSKIVLAHEEEGPCQKEERSCQWKGDRSSDEDKCCRKEVRSSFRKGGSSCGEERCSLCTRTGAPKIGRLLPSRARMLFEEALRFAAAGRRQLSVAPTMDASRKAGAQGCFAHCILAPSAAPVLHIDPAGISIDCGVVRLA